MDSVSRRIYDTAMLDGMPDNLSRLMVAQAQHETAGYTSNAFRKDNNCFGYKYFPGARWQMGSGITSTEKDPYARYASIENSVHELTGWIKRRQLSGRFPADLDTIETPVQYATLLKTCGYFGDPLGNYISGLTHYINNLA